VHEVPSVHEFQQVTFRRWSSRDPQPVPLSAPGPFLSVDDIVETPALRYAFQLMFARVLETETGSSHEVLHGLRDQDLRWAGDRRDARADSHRDPTDLVVDELALAGVSYVDLSGRSWSALRGPNILSTCALERPDPIIGTGGGSRSSAPITKTLRLTALVSRGPNRAQGSPASPGRDPPLL
jgi:hypothetical protein